MSARALALLFVVVLVATVAGVIVADPPPPCRVISDGQAFDWLCR